MVLEVVLEMLVLEVVLLEVVLEVLVLEVSGTLGQVLRLYLLWTQDTGSTFLCCWCVAAALPKFAFPLSIPQISQKPFSPL